MASNDVGFYLRHRRQITQWARLEERVDAVMRDAVKEGDQAKAVNLLKGESGDPEVDFYMRNRTLIATWDSLQAQAGAALHAALLAAAREAGLDAWEGKAGWSEALVPGFDTIRSEHRVWVQLAWTKQHLLTTRRTYPFPRLALFIDRNKWTGQSRENLIKATRPVAHALGMNKRDQWWAHWRMLDPVPEAPDLRPYADDCVARLQEASKRLYPVITEAIGTASEQP